MEWLLVFAWFAGYGTGLTTERFATEVECEVVATRMESIADKPLYPDYHEWECIQVKGLAE